MIAPSSKIIIKSTQTVRRRVKYNNIKINHITNDKLALRRIIFNYISVPQLPRSVELVSKIIKRCEYMPD